jgi:hypothetical protein
MIRERTKQCIPKAHRIGLLSIIVFSGALSLIWGIFLSRAASSGGFLDFQNIYFGSECLLHHCDPYNVDQLDAFYQNEGFDHFYKKQGPEDPALMAEIHQLVTLYVNLPTTFLFIAPFTLFPWGPAHVLWIALCGSSLILSGILIWDIGARSSPGLAAFLICMVLVNCETVFQEGNTASLVVGLCAIAVWCLLEERFVPAGMACFIAALAIKPHDAGLVWLLFLFSGGIYRKRALKICAVVAVLGLAAFLWLSHAVPHWLPEMRANLATISGPGGLNNPGPGSLTSSTVGMVVDLQAALSVFRNNPGFYNPISYVVCGVMLLLWSIVTLRSRFSVTKAWFALAAIVPITLLVTYHRPYDARLLLLCIPACTMLWASGGSIARIAVLLTTTGVVLTGDIPLAVSIILFKKLIPSTAGLTKVLMTLVLTRPASLILLAMAVFYVWVYWNYARSASSALDLTTSDLTASPGDPEQTSLRAHEAAP